jgi:hypothetical protein
VGSSAATWPRPRLPERRAPVLPQESGQCCGAVLSGRITTVAMSRSGQLGSPLREVTPELSSLGGRTQSHRTRGSAGVCLDREARSGAEERVTVPELNSERR